MLGCLPIVSAQVVQDQENQPIVGARGAEAVSVWRFGLSIETDHAAQGIVATAPIPIQCPEQTLEIVNETRGDGVRGIKTKDLRPMARQMVFKIASLQGGQGGETAITFKITKRPIVAPAETDEFVFAKKPRGKLKDYLGPSPFIESKEERIVDIANQLSEKHTDESAWEQVEAIYNWVRENVEYKFDTQIHSCVDALESGKGDCEELSSLFIAICRARDIPARAVWIPGHTYPEFYLVDAEGEGHWFPCQAAGTYQFGEMNERRPILQKGDRFKISGQKEIQRYAQPTLKCKNASGNISIKQIANEVPQ